MRKVLFFIPSLDKGGAENVLVNLVNSMNFNKYEITVQTLFDNNSQKDTLNPKIRYKTFLKKQFRGNSRVLRLFKPQFLYRHLIKDKYDIIVSYLEGPTARIVSGCNDPNTKLVSWIHCKMENESEGSVGFRSFFEAREAYKRYDLIVCVSRMVREFFVNTFSLDKPVVVLYNTIMSDDVYEKSLEPVDDIAFENNVVNICSVGRITHVKGFERLISVHKKLLDEGIDNHIYIIGTGDDQQKLEKQLVNYNIRDTFTFVGFKDNPYKYVSRCDLYVCSSYSEGFSTSVTESLIVGTPVVTTMCSGMKEILGENNEYGIVTENDVDSLYDGIKRIITTPGMLDYYTEKAKERSKIFSTINSVSAVEKAFDELLRS